MEKNNTPQPGRMIGFYVLGAILILILIFAGVRTCAQSRSIEITIDPNPKYWANWEISGSMPLKNEVRLNISYEQLAGWINVLGGIDYKLLEWKIISLRPGFKAGLDSKGLSAVAYLKQEIRINSKWYAIVYERGCFNSREKSPYPEIRVGLALKLNA